MEEEGLRMLPLKKNAKILIRKETVMDIMRQGEKFSHEENKKK